MFHVTVTVACCIYLIKQNNYCKPWRKAASKLSRIPFEKDLTRNYDVNQNSFRAIILTYTVGRSLLYCRLLIITSTEYLWLCARQGSGDTVTWRIPSLLSTPHDLFILFITERARRATLFFRLTAGHRSVKKSTCCMGAARVPEYANGHR